MAVMMPALYDALFTAGADREIARKAAEEAAGYESRFDKLEVELLTVKGEVVFLKWMVGFIWRLPLRCWRSC